jgi:hypothetical protein
LKATFPDGSYLVPSGANGINCERDGEQIADSCQVTSVIPATYEQNQFSLGVDQQIASANRLSGKFFFADQPSRDPLSDGRSTSAPPARSRIRCASQGRSSAKRSSTILATGTPFHRITRRFRSRR